MALSAGDRLGAFEILAPLGAGGMGEVYRARDVRLGRNVAIKVLPARLAGDRNFRRRFEQEARAASALSHPNVAHLYDVGESEGHHFIAMELVEGESLRAALGRGPLPIPRAIDYGLQVAEALEAAHEKGVVHRDIKPANLVISEKGAVKVLDFGLARLEQPELDVESEETTQEHTATGLVMGTVPYMSPEQALGKPVDSRTDVFSLGVTLYEMVAGRLPFSGDTTTQTIDAICHATPPPLVAARPEVPEGLQHVVNRCLEKNRELRYASASDLVVELRRLKEPGNSGAATSPAVRAQPSSRRAWLLAAAAVMAALAVGLFMRSPAPAEAAIDSVAVLPFAAEGDDPDITFLSEGITESLINNLARLPELKVISRTSAFSFRDDQKDLAAIADRLGVRTLVTGRMAKRGDEIAISAELTDVAENRQLWGERYVRSVDDVLAVEREIVATIAGRLRQQLSAAEHQRLASREQVDPRAYQLYLKGRHFMVGTNAEMTRAIEALDEAVRIDPDYALAYASLADAHLNRWIHGGSGRDDAEPAAKRALRRALEIDPDLGEAHTADGMIRTYLDWDWDGAGTAFRRGIELSPGSTAAHLEYANYLWCMGQSEEALGHSRRALELDPLSRMAMHHVGFTLLSARRYAEAIPAFERALEFHPDWIWGYTKLAMTHAFNDSPERALESAARAEELLGDDPNPLLRSWLSALYARAGEPERARDALARLRELNVGVDVDPFVFAEAYAQLGETDRALDTIEAAYAQRSPWIGFLGDFFLFDVIADEPRFLAVLKKAGLRS